MSGLARFALKAYPPSFRRRYGSELAALVEDTGPSARTTADLLVSAARAWARPAFGGPDGVRARLQASTATVWAAWCGGFLVVPAVNRALLDPVAPGTTSAVRTLLEVAYALFFVGWALALLGAMPLVLGCVLPALRARDWPALRPLAPALALGLAECAGLLVIVLTRQGGAAHSGLVERGGIGLWLVGLALFIVALGLGPAASVTRLRPAAAVLRLPAAMTLLLALTLTLATGCSLLAAAASGHATLVSSQVPVWVAIAVACCSSLIAITSSARGVGALRTR